MLLGIPARVIGGLARSRGTVRQLPMTNGSTRSLPTILIPEHDVVDGVHVHRVKNQTDTTPDFSLGA